MEPRVHNRHHFTAPRDAIYVGRGTDYGNPYTEGARHEKIGWYRMYLRKNPELVAQIRRELPGKHLVCSCAPLPCHADVLFEIANLDRDP